MYHPHPSRKLHEPFSHKPFQGVDPASARFLFFGLDANYAPDIERQSCFPEIVSYLEDGVRFWRERGCRHPFRLAGYRGDGAMYHRRFADIGFQPEHADQVAFVELLDVPTIGVSKLHAADLKQSHLERLLDWTRNGRAEHIFMPPAVLRLLLRTPQFSWLPAGAIAHHGSLPVLFRADGMTVYSPYHFSCVGKHCLKKDRDLQIRDIGTLTST